MLGLAPGGFDGAVCLCESGVGVLGGDEEDLTFFRTLHTLLKENAYFALICFNAIRRYIRSGADNSKFDYIRGTQLWSMPTEPYTLKELQRLYTPSEMILLLRLGGF